MSKPLHDKIQDLKREAILDAAAKRFEETGYEMMKISDLATDVGISVGSIYTIFKSKDQLYMAYIHRMIDIFLENLMMMTPNDASPEERLLLFLQMRFDICIQKQKAIDLNLINNPLFEYILTGGEDNPIQKIYNYLSSIIEPLQSLNPSRSSIEMAYLLEGLCHAEVKLWMNYPSTDLSTKALPMHRLFLHLLKENV